MFSAARHAFKRLGFISMLLLVFAVVMPAAQAQACEPVRGVADIAALADVPDDCEAGDCENCGLTCAHGCCHSTPAGLVKTADRSVAIVRIDPVTGWTNALGTPLGARHGLERPPRV